MTNRFQREQLQAHLLDTERLLEIVGDHPVMSVSLSHKVKELRSQMNTLSNPSNLPAKARWENLQSQRTHEEVVEMDAQMLMFQFLSEIQKQAELQGITRKELAEKTGTSAGYLTQIWRGDKPLSFLTLAKMQQALGIGFKVEACSVNLPAGS